MQEQPSPSRPQMEAVAFRAIIVLSILGVLIGSPMIYIGKLDEESYWKLNFEELARSNSPEFKKCLDTAIHDKANLMKGGGELGFCYDTYGARIHLLNEWSTKRKHAQAVAGIGLAASSILPPGLFALFFVLRWIITGRWRRPRAGSGAASLHANNGSQGDASRTPRA